MQWIREHKATDGDPKSRLTIKSGKDTGLYEIPKWTKELLHEVGYFIIYLLLKFSLCLSTYMFGSFV